MSTHSWKIGAGVWYCRHCPLEVETYRETIEEKSDCHGFRELSTESSTPERSGSDSGTQDSPGKGSPEKATGGAPSSSDSPGGAGTDSAKGDSVREHTWLRIGECELCKACDCVVDTLAARLAMDQTPCPGPKPAEDKVNHPSHYTSGGVECIDAIEAVVGQMNGTDGFYTAQVLKYLWRWPLKGGVEDLRKAKWYLERLIAKKEGKP